MRTMHHPWTGVKAVCMKTKTPSTERQRKRRQLTLLSLTTRMWDEIKSSGTRGESEETTSETTGLDLFAIANASAAIQMNCAANEILLFFALLHPWPSPSPHPSTKRGPFSPFVRYFTQADFTLLYYNCYYYCSSLSLSVCLL